MKDLENSVIPYDQGEIEQVLKEMLFDKGITDVLYEGSNVSQLSSVISYVIATLNVNTAINLQETLLPLATKRMNILMGARQLGYETTKQISYVYNLTVNPVYNEEDIERGVNGLPILEDGKQKINIYGTEEKITPLVHNTKFVCGSNSYYYTGPTVNDFWIVTNAEITRAMNTDIEEDRDEVYKVIEAKEGRLYTKDEDDLLSIKAENYQDQDGDWLTKQEYIVPYQNVEENGLGVFLTYVDENGNFREAVQRYKSPNYLIDENLSQNDNLYTVIQNIILDYPTIFFEYGGFGNPIRRGTLIELEVLVSKGTQGEAKGIFKVDNPQIGFEVYEYELYIKGKDAESNESIKENAVVYHNTANRAVTKYDFCAIINRHQLVKDAVAWGGEEEIPKEKGHIWFSCYPHDVKRVIKYKKNPDTSQEYEVMIGNPNEDFNNDMPVLYDWYFTPCTYFPNGDVDVQGEQGILTEYLDNYKMMTMEAHYRHPLFVNFDFNCDIVKYDVTKSNEEVNNGVFGEFNDYFLNNIEKFGSEYINSNIQRVIDKYLSYKSGITYSVNVSGSLCREMLDTFNTELNTLEMYTCATRLNRNVIKCSLAFPFENMFVENLNTVIVNTDLVPKIDTEEFGPYKEKLWVDYETLNTDSPNQNPNYKTAKIYLGNQLFGEYVVNRSIGVIEITFEFRPDKASYDNEYTVSLDYLFGSNYTRDTDYIDFDIKYPYSLDTSTNMPFTKNTMPRLRKVNFVYN